MLTMVSYLQALVFALAVPSAFAVPTAIPARPYPLTDIKSVLGRKLSHNATIYLPSDPGFFAAASRWDDREAPGVAAVLQAKVERDVVEAVHYARATRQTFLIQNAGHGWTDFRKTKNALIIKTDQMDTYDIDTHANTVTLGPGMTVESTINALYPEGKEMPTGSCNCVGMMGAMLGGGHGRLQGLHGLIADNLISARVILANGRLVTASAKSNPDLFYALKGAGHNFGAVLSAKFKIYDATNGGVHYNAVKIFKQDKIVELFSALNGFQQPPQASIYVVVYPEPTTLEPVVLLDYVYAGPKERGRALFHKTFGHIEATSTNELILPWNELNAKSTGGLGAQLCVRGGRKDMYSVSMLEYNTDDVVTLVDEYGDFVKSYPDVTNSSYLFESYPTQGVKSQDWTQSAYSNRAENIIALLTVWYKDASFDKEAEKYGMRAREIMRSHSGFSKPRLYMNYARGDEGLAPIYGQEKWRLEKLVNLKKKYDPEGAFSHYNGIPTKL